MPLARSSIWNAVAWAANAAFALAITAILFRMLGPESYGLWALVVAIKAYGAVLDTGIGMAATRAIARGSGRADLADFHGAIAIAAATGIFAGLALAALFWIPAAVLSISGPAAVNGAVLMTIAGLEVATLLLASPILGAVRGRERFDVLALTSVAASLTGVTTLVMTAPSLGLAGAGLSAVVARLVAAAIAAVWCQRAIPDWIGPPTRRSARRVVTFARPLWLSSLGTQIGLTSDVVVVGWFFGAIAAGSYGLGTAIPAFAAGLLFTMIDVVYPRLAKDRAAGASLSPPITQLATTLAALGFGVLMLIIPDLLTLWTGSAPELAVSVARLYSLTWALNVPAHLLVLLLVSQGRHGFLGVLVLVEAMTSLLLSVLLAATGWATGPAAATLLTLALSNVILVPILTDRRVEFRWRSFAANSMAGFGLGTAMALAIALGLAAVEAHSHRVAVAFTATVLGAATAAYLIAVRRDVPRRIWYLARHGGWRVLLRQRGEVRRVRGVLRSDGWPTPPTVIREPPLVTVRIATYNRGRLVAERSLPSAIAQTHSNLEILVVGDHCDEATERAVRSVKDSRIRFVNLPERGRYPTNPSHRWMVAGAAPMNCALGIARGAWLAPLDDDDEFTTDHVEVLLDACLSRDLDFAYGRAMMEVEPGSWELVGSWPLRLGSIVHAAAFYSSRLRILEHDVDSWRLYEPGDWNLWHRMRDAGARMGFVDAVVARHYLERREQRP